MSFPILDDRSLEDERECWQACVKDWSGSDRSCGFDAHGVFQASNWNCGLVNRLRNLASRVEEGENIRGIDRQYCEDQSYATFNVYWVDDQQADDELGYALWMTWYKHRGRTEALWLLGSEEPAEPRRPTWKEVLLIAKHFEKDNPPLHSGKEGA